MPKPKTGEAENTPANLIDPTEPVVEDEPTEPVTLPVVTPPATSSAPAGAAFDADKFMSSVQKTMNDGFKAIEKALKPEPAKPPVSATPAKPEPAIFDELDPSKW